MKPREMRIELKQAGFWLDRIGKKHELWTNGVKRISLSFGAKTSPHTLNSFKSTIRKYKRARQGEGTT